MTASIRINLLTYMQKYIYTQHTIKLPTPSFPYFHPFKFLTIVLTSFGGKGPDLRR